MKLDARGLEHREEWIKKGYELPEFERDVVEQKTKKQPAWIHFGAGNIFRAFQAQVVQQLLNQGIMDTGLIVAEGYDYEIIEKINRPHDEYSLLVTLKADGTVRKTVVGSIVESCIMDENRADEMKRLREIFGNPSLQMASFTITEKGYSLKDGSGEWLSLVEKDFSHEPQEAQSYIGKVAALLYHRYAVGESPIAMVSMDNCSHNGDKLRDAIRSFAVEWINRGFAETGFLEYLDNREKVSFPWTMIDKITPRPDVTVEEMLVADGVEEVRPIVTEKNTYVAPFVNAEECQYLVVEDAFPNGRPKLEAGGILFADKETVDKAEKMKVCTCLNPLHTALAIFGCLLGYEKISDEMKDEQLRRLVERIGYKEGLPVVVNLAIISPKEFIDTVLKTRIPNPFMPDTPQRIATDTSQKLAIRFGETIKAYLKSERFHVEQLEMIPLVFAGWLRYLMAVDDEGKEFRLSPDPMSDILCSVIKDMKLGENKNVQSILEPVLKDEKIFGINLYEIGMAEKVCDYFCELTAGIGAVRKTLIKYV